MTRRRPTTAELAEPESPERALPTSLEAERAVLGSVLLHADVFDQLAEVLRDEMFFRDAHQRVFKAMARVVDRGEAIDLVTLKNELRRAGELEDVGGPAYLSSLVDGLPHATNVRYYAGIVREKFLLRSLVQAGTKIVTEAYDAALTAAEIVQSADRALLDVQMAGDRCGLVDIRDRSHSVFADLEALVAHKGQLLGVDTGFASMNELTQGWQSGDLIIVAARPSIGKAQPLSAQVLRASGDWARLGDLRVGDVVASVDGRASHVTGIFPQGTKPRYRVTFIDGRSVETCGDHLWETYTSRRVRRMAIRTTREIGGLLNRVRYRGRLSVPLTSGAHGTDRPWPLDPWLLGYLLGNGCLVNRTPRFSTSDPDMVKAVRARLPPDLVVRREGPGSASYRISVVRRGQRPNAVTVALRTLGAMGRHSYEKRIPGPYFGGRYADRLALLRGLLDSDGWAQGAVCFSSASEGLARDVQALAWSLGAVCTLRIKAQPTYSYRGEKRVGRPAYVLIISHRDAPGLFSLARKARKARPNGRRSRLTIVSVEPCGEAPMQCIAVSHPSGLYLTDHYVVTHNTALALNASVAAARQGRHVAIFSLEMRRRQLERRMLSSLARVPLTKIQTGYLSDSDYDGLSSALVTLGDLPLSVMDQTGITVQEIRTACRRQRSDTGLGLVIVDYIQLIRGSLDRRGATRNEELGDVSQRLKWMAGELGVPVIVLSQLRRIGPVRPSLEALRDSGALEQDADVVCFLHRKDHKAGGLTSAIVDKQRNGPTGTINLSLDRDIQLFTDAGEQTVEDARAEDAAERQAEKTRAIIRARAKGR